MTGRKLMLLAQHTDEQRVPAKDDPRGKCRHVQGLVKTGKDAHHNERQAAGDDCVQREPHYGKESIYWFEVLVEGSEVGRQIEADACDQPEDESGNGGSQSACSWTPYLLMEIGRSATMTTQTPNASTLLR